MDSIGSRLGTTQTQDYVLLGVIGLALYVLYNVVSGVKATAAGVGAAYKGAQALAAPVANALAQAWLSMSPSYNSSMAVSGNVLWPDGTTTPVSQLSIKQDTLGNVYVSDGQGVLFQLQPSNAQGNWPAVQITDPSQIGQDLSTNFGVTGTGW